LKELQQREDIHVCDSDKNLGPSVDNSIKYKVQIFTEHLNIAAYKELTEAEATEMNAETKSIIRKMFNSNSGLRKAEITYFGISFKLPK
jgi:hypothetical protein